MIDNVISFANASYSNSNISRNSTVVLDTGTWLVASGPGIISLMKPTGDYNGNLALRTKINRKCESLQSKHWRRKPILFMVQMKALKLQTFFGMNGNFLNSIILGANIIDMSINEVFSTRKEAFTSSYNQIYYHQHTVRQHVLQT